MTEKLKSILYYSIFIILFIAALIYKQFGNYTELSDLYGISFIYVFFRYETINLLFSVIFIILASIVFCYLLIKFKKYESSESKVLRFSIVLCMFIVSSSIIGGLHCINYYGFKNEYKISEDIIEYQNKIDTERIEGAKKESRRKIGLINIIRSKIQKLPKDNFNLSYKTGSRLLTNEKYRYRYDVTLPIEDVKIFFREFEVNRSMRFNFNHEGENTEFIYTLPFTSDFNWDKFKFKEHQQAVVNGLTLYDRLNKIPPKNIEKKIYKKELFQILDLVELDFITVIDELDNRRIEFKELGISWELFIWDTVLTSMGRNQKYFKSFTLTSRSLLFIHALLGLFFIRLILPIAMKK